MSILQKMESKNDVKFLKYVLNFGKVLGVFPMSYKSKVLNSCYSGTVFMFYVIFISYSIIGRCLFEYNSIVLLKHSIIDALQSVTEIVFVLILIYQTNQNNSRWITLFKYIQKLDQMNVCSGFNSNTPKYKFVLTLSLTFIIFLLLNLLDCFINIGYRQYYIIFMFTNANDFYMTIVIFLITFILNKRISYLNKLLLKMLTSNLTTTLTKEKLDEILKFRQHYALIVKVFNKIFGWPLFFYKPAATLAILNCLDSVTHFKNVESRFSIYFTFACFYVVSVYIFSNRYIL